MMLLRPVAVRVGWCLVALAMTVTLAIGTYRWRARRAVDAGERLVDAGDYRAAVRVLTRSLAFAPGEARTHFYLGIAYRRIGIPAGAIRHLREATRLAPQDPTYHHALGDAYRALGSVEAAEREFETAERLDPGDPRYDVDLASVMLATGHAGDAVARLRRAVTLRPGSADLRLLLATALREAGDRDGMLREYRELTRLAGDGPLGEVARQEIRAAEPR